MANLLAEIETLKSRVNFLEKEVASLRAPSTPPAPSQSVPMPPRSYRDATASKVPTTSNPSEGWTQVGGTKRRASSKSKPKPATKDPSSKVTPRSLKDSLEGLSSTDKLKVLLRPPRPEQDRTTFVDIVTVTLPLSRKAQVQPMVAWKQTLQELTGHRPLLVSLINPGKAEVFYDVKVSTQVKDSLSQRGFLSDPVDLQERDLARRKSAYLSGYFLPLRRAALQGLDPSQQLQVLDLAVKDMSSPKSPDATTRKQWTFQINKDREWIQGTMAE